MIEVWNEYNHTIPIIVSIPHSGTFLPKRMKEKLYENILLPTMDWYLNELYSFLKDLEITTLINNTSRYVIDVNRKIEEKKTDSYSENYVQAYTLCRRSEFRTRGLFVHTYRYGYDKPARARGKQGSYRQRRPFRIRAACRHIVVRAGAACRIGRNINVVEKRARIRVRGISKVGYIYRRRSQAVPPSRALEFERPRYHICASARRGRIVYV